MRAGPLRPHFAISGVAVVSSQLLATSVILLVAVVLLLTDRLRADLIALLVVVALGVTGVLTPREAFSGFSSSAVVTIVAIFILAEALHVTGVADQAGEMLLRVTGSHERRMVVTVMVAGALLSLVMNNVAAAAILLPAISGIARKTSVSQSRLLMPLAFATILGGMATLFTTTNIVVSGTLRSHDLQGFGVLAFAPVGIPVVIAGIAYMGLWGRRMLPAGATMVHLGSEQTSDLVEIYRLGERLFRARLPVGSCLAGKSLEQSGLREAYGVNLVGLVRKGHFLAPPPAGLVLAEQDVVVLSGKQENLRGLDPDNCLELLPEQDWQESDLATPDNVVIEAVLAPRSGLLGQTLRAAHFREKYGMAVLGIWRAGKPLRTGLSDLALAFGDALLLQGPRDRIPALRTEVDLIVLDRGEAERPPVQTPGKGQLALLIMVGAVILASLNTSLVGEIMLGGALLTVLVGLFSLDQAYGAIEWRSVFLVAGLLPLGLAMSKSGAAVLLANALVTLLAPLGPLALLAGLLIVTILLTQTMAGVAVASIMAPIAIQAADQAHLDPRALAMGVALATSLAFMTPLGHPVNVLIMGPGGYHFRDYLRVGLPLTLLLFAIIMIILPLFWPLALQ